ncbi:MAG: ferrous iron transport protein B [Chloroflexi bacterium]|nr:ferrous iron transport protein B [Chloroflexota bacterium]
MDEQRVITVALAGQPNVGKSSVFNTLTGLNQHVGNWPGKTVEQRTGTFAYNGVTYRLVDLPGTYSLTANSLEEVIAREYIIRERPDVVAVILSAPVLERNLYLVAELLGLEAPLVVGLNMVDVAEQEGMRIEPRVLEAAMGIPVVPMTATKGLGIQELVRAVDEVAHGRTPQQPQRPEIRRDHQEVLDQLLALIGARAPEGYPAQWVALKLLEGDGEISALMSQRIPAEEWAAVSRILLEHEDAVIAVAGGRYEWVARMVRAAVVRPRAGQITLTSQLDRIATHPFWGLLVLAGILGVVFWLTYTVGAPLQEWLQVTVVGGLGQLITSALAGGPRWLTALLVDGVLGGAGTVITFLPILAIFFATLGLLEDVGYMARAAYVMDRFMHLMGMHGKSFLPLFLGFGCNVSSVVGARVIESPRARLLTVLISPLVPCTGRMAVVTFLAPLFFGRGALAVTWGLVAINLVALAVLGVVLSKTLLRGEQVAFIMEMPLYHLPNPRTIAIQVWQRVGEFLHKAGTMILLVSVLIWLLGAVPTGEIQTSLLAAIGRGLEPVGRLMGLDWRMMLALLSSFAAKENSLATLGVLFGAGDSAGSLGSVLQAAIGARAAWAFLVVQMLFVPCVATVAAMRQETRSWGWTLAGVVLLLVLSLLGGTAAYQIAGLL